MVGGYTPEKVALRRAIALAYDVEREITVVRRGQAMPAQSPIAAAHHRLRPGATRSENSEYDPARAKALLDMYGYVDRDGDGWREQPDGSPLAIECRRTPDQATAPADELWQEEHGRDRRAPVGAQSAKWPEQLKAARAGKLHDLAAGLVGLDARRQGALERVYGPASGGANLARFRLPAFDGSTNACSACPTGPSAQALFTEANNCSSPTRRTRCTCTASSPTSGSPGSSAIAGRCSGRTGGSTSTSTWRTGRPRAERGLSFPRGRESGFAIDAPGGNGDSRRVDAPTIGFGFSRAAGALPQPPQLLQPELQPPAAAPPRSRGTKRRSAKPSATSTPPPTIAGSMRA